MAGWGWGMHLREHHVAAMRTLKPRQFGKPFAQRGAGIDYVTTGLQHLLNHKLVEYRKLTTGKEDLDKSRSGFFLTERGRAVLEIVEQDIALLINPDGAPRKAGTQ